MTKFAINNVRLSFPSIFQKSVYNGQEGKYQATFLIDKKDIKTKAIIDKAIDNALSEAKIKVPSSNYCLTDGDEIFDDKGYDGYQGNWSLKAANEKRPTIINRDKTPLTQEDEKIYAGCYVNAIIDIWIQNNAYGKRVNANLYGIQFVKDAEPFGMGPVDVTEDFDDLEDEL